MLGEGKVPLLTGGSGPNVTQREVDGFGYMIEFDADVMPILKARCVSCHQGDAAAAGLRFDVQRDWDKVNNYMDDSTYARLVLDISQKFVPPALQRISSGHGATLGKPNLSKYVRMMNSRGSLLYWKAKNARTDNRTDATRDDDIDFGADHPTQITPEELGILARWIDIGAGWGPEFKETWSFRRSTSSGSPRKTASPRCTSVRSTSETASIPTRSPPVSSPRKERSAGPTSLARRRPPA